jgi:hypothetical protein
VAGLPQNVEVRKLQALSGAGAETKNPLARAGRTRGQRATRGLSLFDGDRVFRANLDAAFAPKALFRVCRNGFSITHLKNLDRADVYTLFAANALFFVDGGIKSHSLISFRWFLSKGHCSLMCRLAHSGCVIRLIKMACQALM